MKIIAMFINKLKRMKKCTLQEIRGKIDFFSACKSRHD